MAGPYAEKEMCCATGCFIPCATGCPPNTPATDTKASVAWSTGPGPSVFSQVTEPNANSPAGARPKPLPGIKVPPSNQFVPTSDWTRLQNPRDTPASSTKYRTPFDELDLELGRSSLVETPLSCFETEEAVDGLLKQYPDLTGGSSHDVEMTDMTYAPTLATTQFPGNSPGQFQPEISNSSGYHYNIMDQEDGTTTAPTSPVTPEDDELLDMVSMIPSPVPDSCIVGNGRPKSTTPKKWFRGPDNPGTPKQRNILTIEQ